MGLDSSTWIKMAERLPLSRSEQEVLRRFEQDPGGRQFLPLSDVFRAHKLLDESIELLTQGVQDHPGFSVARVVLARELYHRGLILDAWTVLDQATSSLTDNVLAQKLKYKMAILLGDEGSARSAFQHLKIQQGIDPEIHRIHEQLDMEGLPVARDAFQRELKRRGVDIKLPVVPPLTSSSERSTLDGLSGGPLSQPPVRTKKFILEYELDDPTRKHVENFHVVPLVEVFAPGSEPGPGVAKGSSVELDSTTLAEIYAKQGFYAKALAIYRRLLRMAPHNDLLRLKVSEMARLEKQQRDDDLESDPVLYEKMEIIDIIDRQMRFMNRLLENL